MIRRTTLLIFAGLFGPSLSPTLEAEVDNFWPFYVSHRDSAVGRPDAVSSLGPLLARTDRDDERILSFRPLWTSFHHQTTGALQAHVFYPFVNWRDDGHSRSGHVLNLLQYRRNPDAGSTFLQAFPFLFINDAPEPEASYRALWPLGGTLKNRFWRDEIRFALWPLFVQTRKDDEVRTHVPYPFVQMLDGPRSRGFGLWPLYGRFERENDYVHTWAFWPFHYHYRDKLDEPVPYERFGMLPFYTRETGAGLKSETYLWPFFGYTRESDPRPRYAENRYFWPFLVQGRGEERRVNRWMPFYTHETRPGYSKRWYLWPLLELESWEHPGLERRRTSLLYFLFRDEQQLFSGTRARLSFLWPFYGYWNDGFDRRQFQVFDPLTVFFPSNRVVRENWTPLFALYRFDRRGGNARHSLAWDLLSWERDPDGLRSFHAGPVFEWEKNSHWAVLKGLIGSQRENGEWTLNLFWQK
jgi:hypothetical protein